MEQQSALNVCEPLGTKADEFLDIVYRTDASDPSSLNRSWNALRVLIGDKNETKGFTIQLVGRLKEIRRLLSENESILEATQDLWSQLMWNLEHLGESGYVLKRALDQYSPNEIGEGHLAPFLKSAATTKVSQWLCKRLDVDIGLVYHLICTSKDEWMT